MKLFKSVGGTMGMKSQLTARLFEPIDKSLTIDFLKSHPVTTHPELYREVKERRFGFLGRPVVRTSKKVVTTAFANFLAAQLITDSVAIGDFKYHDSGTGTVAEAAGDVGLGTPWGGARDVGTQVQGGDATKYKSVATTTYTGTFAITEHGLFNAATGVTLMDRSVFAAVNVVSGNQIGNGLPLRQLNGQYGVNCGNSKGNAYDNPQLSSLNDIKVGEKVQRLEVEESTNKTSDSAPRPVMDEEIVQAKEKSLDKLANSLTSSLFRRGDN